MTTSITYKGHVYATPYVDLLPPLTPEERQALKADVEANGFVYPAFVSDEYEVIDGHNRLQLAVELGRTDLTVTRLPAGLTEDAKREMAENLNLCRRHLTRDQKQAIIARRLKADPRRSDREVAAHTRVDHKTVGSVRKKLESTGEIPQLVATQGRDGKTRSRPVPSTPASPPPPAGEPAEPGSDTTPAPRGQRLPKGVLCANEAINHLMRIPKDDPLRARGFQIVFAWMRDNPSPAVEPERPAADPTPAVDPEKAKVTLRKVSESLYSLKGLASRRGGGRRNGKLVDLVGVDRNKYTALLEEVKAVLSQFVTTARGATT